MNKTTINITVIEILLNMPVNLETELLFESPRKDDKEDG
jgi:hypothetical protein